MYSSLSTNGPVKWNHNQETTFFQHASPFEPAYDGRSTTTLAERTRELYLQYLWLPEVRVFFSAPRESHAYLYQSTMPLGQLVKMIQLLARQHSASSSSSSSSSSDIMHPLHPALDDILLTGSWCTYKYQERLLPSVVVAAATGAASHAPQGSSDLEVSIMLFVLEHHALCEEDQDQQQQQRACCSLDDQKRWLSGIEKRE